MIKDILKEFDEEFDWLKHGGSMIEKDDTMDIKNFIKSSISRIVKELEPEEKEVKKGGEKMYSKYDPFKNIHDIGYNKAREEYLSKVKELGL